MFSAYTPSRSRPLLFPMQAKQLWISKPMEYKIQHTSVCVCNKLRLNLQELFFFSLSPYSPSRSLGHSSSQCRLSSSGSVKIPIKNASARSFRHAKPVLCTRLPCRQTIHKADNIACFRRQLKSYYFVFNSLVCLLYTSPSPRDAHRSRMPSSA